MLLRERERVGEIRQNYYWWDVHWATCCHGLSVRSSPSHVVVFSDWWGLWQTMPVLGYRQAFITTNQNTAIYWTLHLTQLFVVFFCVWKFRRKDRHWRSNYYQLQRMMMNQLAAIMTMQCSVSWQGRKMTKVKTNINHCYCLNRISNN